MIRAEFLSTEGPYLQAFLEVGDQTLCVMDEFSVDYSQIPRPGDAVDFEFVPLLDESEPWESIFSGNPRCDVDLVQINGWKYRAFGKIISINPVTVDCGLFTVQDVVHSNDPKIIGEFVAFTIARLGGYLHAT